MRALVVLVLLAGRAAAQAPGVETTYVVQPGDTCLGIAVKILGDRGALDAYHKVNPQLGPLPHDLVPGQIVNLPPRAVAGPDAKLSRATGDVKVRSPSATVWAPATRGMELFRAWRVGAAEKASAELTFRDDSYLGMRERTIVVIYGPEKKLARVITATATLEEGALEARLGDLDGKPVVVRTPTSETDLRAGDVLVTTAPSGSIIANHRGAPVAVRGKVPGKAVKVSAGMGSRVRPGKPPEPPRPLPATPSWSNVRPTWIVLGGTTATAGLVWKAIDGATTYRLAVRDASGDPTQVVVATKPEADVVLAPGTYTATVAAIDADGFESTPSAPLPIAIVSAQLIPVGGTRSVTSTTVAKGATLVAPAGKTCELDGGAPAGRLALDRVGTFLVTCGPSVPLNLDVTAIALSRGAADRGDLILGAGERASFTLSAASPGVVGEDLSLVASPELHATIERPSPTTFVVTIDAAAATARDGRLSLRAGAVEIAARTVRIEAGPALRPVVRAPAPAPWRIGAYGGYQLLDLGRASDLGDPVQPGAAFDRGGLFGLRAGWLRHRLGVEVELGLSRAGHRQNAETSTILTARAHAMLGYREGFGRLALVAGGGTQTVVHANGGSVADTDPVFDWGAMFGVAPRGILCRLDLRHVLFAASGGGIAHGLELTAGVSIELPR